MVGSGMAAASQGNFCNSSACAAHAPPAVAQEELWDELLDIRRVACHTVPAVPNAEEHAVGGIKAPILEAQQVRRSCPYQPVHDVAGAAVVGAVQEGGVCALQGNVNQACCSACTGCSHTAGKGGSASAGSAS